MVLLRHKDCLRICFWDEKSEKNVSFSSHLPLIEICILRHWLLCVSRSFVNGCQAIQAVFHALPSTGKPLSRAVLGQCYICLKLVRPHEVSLQNNSWRETSVWWSRQVSLKRGSMNTASSPQCHFHEKDCLIHLVRCNIYL